MEYENTHEYYREYLHEFKYGIGVTALDLTEAQRKERAAQLPRLERQLNISDEELDNSKAKVMLWNAAALCPYWGYLKK